MIKHTRPHVNATDVVDLTLKSHRFEIILPCHFGNAQTPLMARQVKE
ncbi:hypothetical protein HMPREF0880_03077 [Yokenella regensburgei ATCC 43003]|nr:hypothetical protein HMPREF0880_03077 [Yokenella regensburgei ATCC 43003]